MANRGPLRDRDVHAVEEMDLPGCDPARLDRTYAQFCAGQQGRCRLARHLPDAASGPSCQPTTATTLLDIGCGGGDVPVLLAAWAARDRLQLEITAIDPDRARLRLRRGAAAPPAA